jgi:hypothetical protein
VTESTEPTQPIPPAPPEPLFAPEPTAPPLAPPPPPPAAFVAPAPAAPGPRPPIYPMITTFDETVTMSRLWGIPILGIMVRWLLLIPHFVVLAFYAVLVALLQLVTWIPVLVYGRYPGWGYSIVGGFIRWITRVQAYAILAASAYPPLSTGGRHDVDVRWDESQQVARWAGIPVFGVWIRSFLLIPHLILLWFLGIAVGFLSLVTWIPVLLDGRYADWAYRIVGGYVRWQNRTLCYVLLMTGPYPPFSLDD